MSISDIRSSVSSTGSSGVDAAKSARATLDQSFNWIVKPVRALGIEGFTFDYEGSTQLSAEADVTDHFTESNNFFNDHVARKPLKLTLRGFIAELVLKKPTGIVGALALIQNRLTQVPAYLGRYTPTQLAKIQAVVTKTQNVVSAVDEAIKRADNLMDAIGNASPARTAQQKAYAKLMSLWSEGHIFNIASPWGYLTKKHEVTGKPMARNFVLERVVFTQDEDSDDMVDISITVKEVQIVGMGTTGRTFTAEDIAGDAAGRAASQRADVAYRGLTEGTSVPVSELKSKLPL